MTDHTAKIIIMDKENSVAYSERLLTVIDARRGLFEASITVEAKSSVLPCANFEIVFAVVGETTITSAHLESEM